MNRLILSASLAIMFLIPQSAYAATYSDSSWPCIQRKVEKLSIGIMWPHPIPEQDLEGLTETAARDLITKLSLRRISLEETKPLIADFVQANGTADADFLGQIFRAVFIRLAIDRQNIIDGIKRYSFKQIALSKTVDETRDQMTALSAATEPDFDQIDKLEERLDWDERIYKERARSLIYVCETPVLLEKRLFGISKTLQSHITKP